MKHDDCGVQGGEIDLEDVLVEPGYRLEHHPSPVAGTEVIYTPGTFGIGLTVRYRNSLPECLKHFITGDQGPGSEPCREVRAEAGKP